MVDDVGTSDRYHTSAEYCAKKNGIHILVREPGLIMDMIPLGRISILGERGEDQLTRLTRDEQYT